MSRLTELRTPFLATLAPRVCECELPAFEIGRFKIRDKAVAAAAGHYHLFLTFYGDHANWLEFSVIDIRDGQIIWRNGRQLQEDTTNGKIG